MSRDKQHHPKDFRSLPSIGVRCPQHPTERLSPGGDCPACLRAEGATDVQTPAERPRPTIRWFGESPETAATAPDLRPALKQSRQERQELVEAEAWLAGGSGSARLKKVWRAGYLANSLQVYREERLSAELGEGWRLYREDDDGELRPIHNPTEAHLDALLEARNPDGRGVNLAWVEPPHDEAHAAAYRGAVLETSWRGRTAVKRLDDKGWETRR